MRLLPIILLFCACSTSSPDRRDSLAERWPDLAAPADDASALELSIFRARRPSGEESARLDEAIRSYVDAGDEAFIPLRDQLAADPVTAFWLARTLGVFSLQALARAGEVGLQVQGDPAWQRPLSHLAAMGAAAVPFVVVDLLEHSQGSHRDLGVRVLQAMGPGELPAWSFLLRAGDLRMRRLAMRVFSSWEPTESTMAHLEEGLRDPDFGIRASAYRGLAKGGEEQAERLRRAIASESDPFVRRAILESMSSFKDRATAMAVLAFYERSLEVGEFGDLRRADQVLQEISGLSGTRNLAGWRTWIQKAFDGS